MHIAFKDINSLLGFASTCYFKLYALRKHVEGKKLLDLIIYSLVLYSIIMNSQRHKSERVHLPKLIIAMK
jgi:hypothetical protein